MMWFKLWLRDTISLAWWLLRWLLGRRAPQGVRILLYHTIADIPRRRDTWRLSVPPALFEAQLRWLRDHGYVFVRLDDVLEMVLGRRSLPPKAVAVTFDDGFRDVLTRAYPLLQRYHVPATAFVVPGHVGDATPVPWLDPGAAFERPLTWEELARLGSDHVMSVGSHAWSHQPLSRLASHAQQEEIEQSKVVLEERLGQRVRWFAYPYGHAGSFSATTIVALQRAGFQGACANIMGVNQPGDSPWMLKRMRIGWEDRLWRFRLKMVGAYDWVDARQRRVLAQRS